MKKLLAALAAATAAASLAVPSASADYSRPAVSAVPRTPSAAE